MTSSKINNIAYDILQKVSITTNTNVSGSIAILMIVSIILTCIRVIQECKKKQFLENTTDDEKYEILAMAIQDLSTKKGWFTKMRIKKILRKHLEKSTYSIYHTSLVDALLTAGTNITDQDIKTILTENPN